MVDSFKMADDHNDPNISTVMRFYHRAKELMKSGRNDDAFDSFTEFIRNEDAVLEAGYRDELAQAYNERGHIRYLRVDFGNAIDDYTKSIHLDEEFAVAYYNRGQVHYRLGRYRLAREDLLKAIELDPDFIDAVRNLRQIEKDLGSGYRFNTEDPCHNQTYRTKQAVNE